MKGRREQDESSSEEITPADRVRALRVKHGQDKSGHEVFTPADTNGPVPAKYGTCEHCGRPLEPDSRILGIDHCPTCDGPFSRRVLMRWRTCAFWGGAITIGFGLIFYFSEAEWDIESSFFLLGMWLVITLFVALKKILPGNPGYGGVNGGG